MKFSPAKYIIKFNKFPLNYSQTQVNNYQSYSVIFQNELMKFSTCGHGKIQLIYDVSIEISLLKEVRDPHKNRWAFIKKINDQLQWNTIMLITDKNIRPCLSVTVTSASISITFMSLNICLKTVSRRKSKNLKPIF